MNSYDPLTDIKFHTNRIKVFAGCFVGQLLEITDDGKLISAQNIKLAKQALQDEQGFDYE